MQDLQNTPNKIQGSVLETRHGPGGSAPRPIVYSLFADFLPATLASWLFFEHIKPGSASESFHLLPFLPGKFTCSRLAHFIPVSAQWYHLFRKSLTDNLTEMLVPMILYFFRGFIFFFPTYVFSLIYCVHRIYLPFYFVSACVSSTVFS